MSRLSSTLGEETLNPRRNIPIALLVTVLGSGLFFMFVAYCEVIGFGPQGIKALGPLAWVIISWAATRIRPAVTRVPLPDFS